ncbi:mechanosensitive ion channel domain-containing protein [Orrella sp. JC864]|uniref:mechanosensitive ion channel family protein n=1 Tax=Orrella sp. JC864 TaxID=3120298 RepID=UPI00300B7C79
MMNRLLLALLCILALSAGRPAGAAAPQAPAGEAPRQAQAIAVGDIAWQADADEQLAGEIAARAAQADPLGRIEPALIALERSVGDKRAMFRSEDLLVLPQLQLDSLERHWRLDAARLARWKADLRVAIGPSLRDVADMAERRQAWLATRAAHPAGSLPQALSDRIDAVLAQIALAEAALSAPLARQMALAQRVNVLENSVQAGQEAVADAIDHIDRRLLHVDAPPLWRAEQAGAAAGVGAGLGMQLAFLRQYGEAGGGGRRALALLQVLMLPLLAVLAVRARRRDAPLRDPESLRILQRPVSAWILLTMIGVLTLERDGPPLLHQIAMVLALLPVLRLLPTRLREQLGAWPYVVSGFYLLQRGAFLLLADNLLYRWYTFWLALAALALTLWLVRRPGAAAGARTGGLLRAGAWCAAALLALSVLCNLLGNVSLAEMLVNGVILTAYMGLVLYAAVAVFEALLRECLGLSYVARLHLARVRGQAIVASLVRAFTAVAVLAWVVFTLDGFRLFRPLYGWLHAALTARMNYGELSISLGTVLLFVFSVWLAFWIARTVRLVLREEVLPQVALPRGVDNSIASLSYYALVLLGLYVALSAAGFQMGQMAFLFGALGVGIGLGLQGVVNNFVSGLILMFERPLQPGDVVDIGGTAGRVRSIGMRSTTVRTFEGADVVVPNGMLLSEKLTNWTLLDRTRRVDVEVGVAYGSDVERVKQLLHEAVARVQGILGEPAPVVLFTGMGESALDFVVRGWTADFDNWAGIRSELVTNVYTALQEAGIEIPFPQRDLHLRSVDGQAARALGAGAPPAGQD